MSCLTNISSVSADLGNPQANSNCTNSATTISYSLYTTTTAIIYFIVNLNNVREHEPFQ